MPPFRKTEIALYVYGSIQLNDLLFYCPGKKKKRVIPVQDRKPTNCSSLVSDMSTKSWLRGSSYCPIVLWARPQSFIKVLLYKVHTINTVLSHVLLCYSQGRLLSMEELIKVSHVSKSGCVGVEIHVLVACGRECIARWGFGRSTSELELNTSEAATR